MRVGLRGFFLLISFFSSFFSKLSYPLYFLNQFLLFITNFVFCFVLLISYEKFVLINHILCFSKTEINFTNQVYYMHFALTSVS